MKKLIVVGVLVGLLLVLGITVGVASAQGPTPTVPTLAQMKAWHESVHGAGTWDAMAQAMQQAWGNDWFNQMHGPNGFMQNAWNGNAPYGRMGCARSSNGTTAPYGMMGSWRR